MSDIGAPCARCGHYQVSHGTLAPFVCKQCACVGMKGALTEELEAEIRALAEENREILERLARKPKKEEKKKAGQQTLF